MHKKTTTTTTKNKNQPKQHQNKKKQKTPHQNKRKRKKEAITTKKQTKSVNKTVCIYCSPQKVLSQDYRVYVIGKDNVLIMLKFQSVQPMQYRIVGPHPAILD